MKIGAVVCEYNPFHSGHQYQLETARTTLGLDAIVGMMSGNYVQRGDVAIYPKELRARGALACGMDLVLELPAILTLQSAERYARNAVQSLDALGCVDYLFFGAECPDTEVLKKIAAVLANESVPFRQQLQQGLSRGLSFAAARAEAVRTVIGAASAEILSQPNNILAVEYCKALLQCGSRIQPVALPRRGATHHQTTPEEGFASASAIRGWMAEGAAYSAYLPSKAFSLYGTTPPFTIEALEKAILARLCLMTPTQLADIADVGEGLENALLREALTAETLPQMLEAVKSKRYAYSRLRRISLCAYLGITREDTLRAPSYLRILDFNSKGQEVLNLARKTATLPLAKHGGQIKDSPDALALWQRELALDRVYHLFRGDRDGNTTEK